jgi:hypothetical protein
MLYVRNTPIKPDARSWVQLSNSESVSDFALLTGVAIKRDPRI